MEGIKQKENAPNPMPLRFECVLCGECCSGDMKVFVNSHDIWKMGRFLKMNRSCELFEAGRLIMDKGQNELMLPRIRFKSSPFSFCPFLINDFDEETGLRGLCSLHLIHKPLVCRLAPLSRKLDLETGTDDFDFILPLPGCPGGEGKEILDPAAEKKALKPELDFELRYYRLLSANEQDPSFLWNFSLNAEFEEIINSWEKDFL